MSSSFFPDGYSFEATDCLGSRVGCSHSIEPMSNVNWTVYKDSDNGSEVSCLIVCLEDVSGPRWSLQATVTLAVGDRFTNLTWWNPSLDIATVENAVLSSGDNVIHVKLTVPRRENEEITYFRLKVQLHKIDFAGGRHEIELTNPQTKHDCVIVACEKRFYLQSVVLAMNSRYFDRIFQENPVGTKPKEIEVDCGTVRSAFIFEQFLKLIYPSDVQLCSSSLDDVLYLADRFEMPNLINKCSRFIVEDREMRLFPKLQLSHVFRLLDAQNEILKQLRSSNLEELKNEEQYPTYENLSPDAQRMIDELLSVQKNSN